MRRDKGYTLIELLVVMAIIATLMSIVGPQYFKSLDKARDTALLSNLKVIRDAIDRYRGDTGRWPESLGQLARERYLRELPLDPVTERADTWTEVAMQCSPASASAPCQGIVDVRSGAPGLGGNGVEYAKW